MRRLPVRIALLGVGGFIVPLAIGMSLFNVDCSAPPEKAETCTSFPPKCEGPELVVCNNNTIARLDCSKEGLACVKNGKGEGTCAKHCPKTMDKYGACDGNHLQSCDGDALVDLNCSKQAMQCGYMIEGYATCSKPCPPFIDGYGTCTGPGLRRCNGQVFFDQNCLDQSGFCNSSAEGIVQCSKSCPAGLDTFGSCDGQVAKRCDGTIFRDEDCSKVGKKCEEINRFGVGCRGCTTSKPEGVCSATSQMTICTGAGKDLHESCIARGGTCEFDTDECRNGCVDTKPARLCTAEMLSDGQQKCKQNAFTKFWSIEECKGDRVYETECPAASDNSVSCVLAGGVGQCQTTCNAYGRRCTDRGVLVACTTAGLAWMDCAELGAKCMDDGTDAYCACGAVPEYAARCTTDKHGWNVGYSSAGLLEMDGGTGVIDAGDPGPAVSDGGMMPADGGVPPGTPLQYICLNGRIDVTPCECASP